MRILFCHWKGWPFGGGEIYLFKLFQALINAGHHVAFLTQEDKLNTKIDGVFWHEIPPAPGVRGAKGQWERIRSILVCECPDVIHLHETCGFIGPFVLKKIIGRFPLITTIHFAGIICPGGGRFSRDMEICLRSVGPNCIRCCKGVRSLKDMFFQTLWLRALRKASCTLVGSSWLKALCLENGFSPRKTYVLPPYWHEPCHETALPCRHNNILFVGRIRKDKGVFDLLNALADLRSYNWRLILVGKLDPVERVAEYVAGIGLQDRLWFTGFVPHGEILKFYQQAAFLVFPSIFPETFGIAGVEAMSAGIPVVAYDGGGVGDWLAHGTNGLLVNKGDITGLGEAIKTLLEDAALRKGMGRAAYKSVVEKYSLRLHLSTLLKIYEQAMHQG